MPRRTYVELFAGCGGLSLGLSSIGYERLLANELSPMAAETYAFNLLGADLNDPEFSRREISERPVLWLRSAHPAHRVEDRLLENPLNLPEDGHSDVDSCSDLTGKLLVGDIRQLNQVVRQRGTLLSEEPDVISGGPPCQSFSLAGLREYGNHRNRLPWEFAQFVEAHHPKIAILENVSGILLPFHEDGKPVHAWFEVAKAFAAVGYAPICLHVNAVDVGVAQNRPRFLMFALRADLVDEVAVRLGPSDAHLLTMGRELLEFGGDVEHDGSRHKVIDIRGRRIFDHMGSPRLRRIFHNGAAPVPVRDAIEDLSCQPQSTRSDYVRQLSALFTSAMRSAGDLDCDSPANTEHRSHTPKVRSRFRLYQILAEMDSTTTANEIARYLRGNKKSALTPIPSELAQQLLSGEYPVLDVDDNVVSSVIEVQELVKLLQTQKHSQKALRAALPAPAALSIPDDACHYRDVRTLSVREMARIQSFPDEFVFRSNPTTGGPRRKFQVPQYTQVGNAVPPKLGRAIGKFADFLLGNEIEPDAESQDEPHMLTPLPID